MAVMALPPGRFSAWRPTLFPTRLLAGVPGMALVLLLALAGCDTAERRAWHALAGGAADRAGASAPADIAGMPDSAPGIEGGADDDDGDVPGPVLAGGDWVCAPRYVVARGMAIGREMEEGPGRQDEPPDGVSPGDVADPGGPWARHDPWVPGYPWPDPAHGEPVDLPADIAQPVPWSPFGTPPGIDVDGGKSLTPITGMTIAGPVPSWSWVPLRWGGGEGVPRQPVRGTPAPPAGDDPPEGEGGPDALPDPQPESGATPPKVSIAEPATVVLLGGAMMVLGLLRRRARAQRAR